MFTRLRSHLSYANVTATLALFVALGGSSYAALKITGRDVRNNSLTGRDIRSLTTKDVTDGSLRARDLDPSFSRNTEYVVRSHPIAMGVPGGAGSAQNRSLTETARCEPGEHATGGGVGPFNESDVVALSRPAATGPNPTGWTGAVVTPGESRIFPGGIVYAVCASP
jgi:hypothetical protein